LESLQGGHSQEFIMVFYMFGVKFQSSLASIVKNLTLQAIVGSKNCPNKLWRNVGPS